MENLEQKQVSFFFAKRSEVTTKKNEFEKEGAQCFRTSLKCNCLRNQRTCAVIVIKNNIHIANIIKCKDCAKKLN